MDAIDLVSERVRELSFGRAISEILWFISIADRIQKNKDKTVTTNDWASISLPITVLFFPQSSLRAQASGNSNLRTFLDWITSFLVSTNAWNLSVFGYESIFA